ncbi:MAG TPA: hypothetical protein VF556_17715 [Pyrinomonadaceae bacterium]|jgi:hypothetical protein
MDNLKSLVVSVIPSSPAFYVAVEFPSATTIITTIVLPVVFFILSKTVDVLVQFYFKRKGK